MKSVNDGNISMHLDRDIASAIGKYFYEVIAAGKEPFAIRGEMFQRCKDTQKLVDSFKIVGIHFNGSDILITTSRPGLLIGRKGERINKLAEALHKEFTFNKVLIIEDQVISRLNDFHYVLDGYETERNETDYVEEEKQQESNPCQPSCQLCNRRYKVKWENGTIEDNVIIHDGAAHTWEDVKVILHEYGPA